MSLTHHFTLGLITSALYTIIQYYTCPDRQVPKPLQKDSISQQVMSPGPGTSVGLRHGEKFCGTGYFAWKFNIKMALIQQEVWSCIEKKKIVTKSAAKDEDEIEAERKEKLAYTFIMLPLSREVQAVVRRCNTAKETWDLLEVKYGGKDVQDRMYLRQKLRDLKLKPSESMMNYLARVQDCVDQLKAAGGELADEEIVLTLLNSLPKKYEVVKASLNVRGTKVELDELQNILLAEERRLVHQEEIVEDKRIYTVSQRKSRKEQRSCYKCGKAGHLSFQCNEARAKDDRRRCWNCNSCDHLEYNCPNKKRPNSRMRNGTHDRKIYQGNSTFSAIEGGEEYLLHSTDETANNYKKGPKAWLLDSGASKHMVGSDCDIIMFERSHNSQIRLADGGSIQSSGVETVCLVMI